jgi:hypothetical protein
MIARPSPQMARLEIDKREAQVEVAKIKSVQLEFVKHSLLQRKVISIEKKIELLQLQYNPRLQAVRKVFRVLRVSNTHSHHVQHATNSNTPHMHMASTAYGIRHPAWHLRMCLIV